jgi:hypothetical protein
MTPERNNLRQSLQFTSIGYWLVVALLLVFTACGLQTGGREIPAEVESQVTAISDDIAAERYEKIYNEAADLWRQDSDLEHSTAMLKQLREKLGGVKNRTVHSAIEQENSGGPLQGRSFTLTYQTNFERGEGMETFTFVQRNSQWLLARYRVNSTALK